MHSNWTRNVFKQSKIAPFLIESKSVEILLFSGAVKLQNSISKYPKYLTIIPRVRMVELFLEILLEPLLFLSLIFLVGYLCLEWHILERNWSNSGGM